VWSPVARSAFSVDYMHWHISNEVQEQDSNQLLKTESACLLGQLDPTSPTCVAAIDQVTRDPATGLIVQIDTPKQNLAEENLAVLVFNAQYGWNIGAWGNMEADAAYTHTLTHNVVQYPGDPQINLLSNPFWSTEFQDKANASVTWNYKKFSTTLYGEFYGTSPNYAATLYTEGYATPQAAKLPSWWLANWSASYEFAPGFTVTANVVNLFNKMPPFDDSYPGYITGPYNSLNYNNYGQSYFIGATYKFGAK
jgi:iron complex outermembrane recepter protein